MVIQNNIHPSLESNRGSPLLQPFVGDLEYLEQEWRWIEARCRRLGAQLLLQAPSPADDPDETPRRPRELADSKARAAHHAAEEQRLRAEVDARLAVTRAAGATLAIDRVCAAHKLRETERTLLLLASAHCVSKRFERLYGMVTSRDYNLSMLTVEVAFNFLEFDFAERIRARGLFAPSAPLFECDLLTLDVGRRFVAPANLHDVGIEMPANTFDLLLGRDAIGAEMSQYSCLEVPRASMHEVVLDADDKRRIMSVVEGHDRYLAYRQAWGVDDIVRYGRGALMLFHGEPGTGKTMMAHAVAAHLGKQVFNVDIPAFCSHAEGGRALPALFREARLRNALLFFDECEPLFEHRRNGNQLMSVLLTEIERFEGVAILATNQPDLLDEALDRRLLVKVAFPKPDVAARLDIWRRHIPEQMPLGCDVDLAALATRYECTGGYIKNALLTAVAAAVRDREDPVVEMAHLERAIREQLWRPLRADSDRYVITRPTITFADIVLPAELRGRMDELVCSARNRRKVLETWGVGRGLSYGKGLAALFYGEPGTGKTMCVEALAAELERPLITASVPGLQSKWVGEAEKNLRDLFVTAQTHSAVLFLDEADSLLATRGSGRASRHDDSLVNTILQLIERHDGILILATNLLEQLDPALERRMHERVRFVLPGPSQRAQIWAGLVPPGMPVQGDLDFQRLGVSFPMAGGYIRNAVFKAAYRAAHRDVPVTQALLEECARESAPRMTSDSKAMGFALPGSSVEVYTPRSAPVSLCQCVEDRPGAER